MSYLEERKQALENAFFAKKNSELLDKVKAELDLAKQRDALKATTGIEEDAVLDRITELGVGVESLTALSIAPLVMVAWADGTVDLKERNAILQGAEKSGVKSGSTAHALLQGWLEEKPDDSLYQAWESYTVAISEKLQPGELLKLKEQVLGRCKLVAEAAGGFLGLGSISASEQAVLDKLAKAFEAR